MKKLIAVTMLALAICAMAITARAVTITVTNTNDSGPGSLRNALSIANDGDTITFAVTGSIGLTSGQLLVNHGITISGPGAENLAVNGNASSRVFHVSLVGGGVTISGLTITNGHASGNYPDNSGGGIYNDHAVLTLNNCVIDGNYAAFWGSGIYNFGDSATLITLNDCTISGNNGAGIANGGQAMVTLNSCAVTGNNGSGIYNIGGGYNPAAIVIANNCTLSGNTAGYNEPASGGGLYNAGGLYGGNAQVALNNCTVSDNWASASGGGIYNDAFGGSVMVTLNNCTVSGNTAANNDGGGISNHGNAAVVISNSTLSNNSAYSNGGGIFNTTETTPYGGNATVNISNSTLSGNSAPGGGIYNSASGGYGATAILGNTILKAGALGGNIYNVSGTIISHGHNLSSDAGAGYLTNQGDQINTDPLLGPLQDNGGPTFTQALLPGSPAINAGDPNFTPPPSYDQRGLGFDRVVNGRIDIGSFEVQEATPTPTPTPTATYTPTPRPTATPTPSPSPTPTPTATPTATPCAAPTVTTSGASNVASSSATLNGTVNPNGCNTTLYFQYGTSTNYGSVTANQTKTGNTYQSVNANISGLTANTTYHFRIVGTNSGGTRYGIDRTFTTTGPPAVTTNPASNVTASSATLHGLLDPHGLSTIVHFQYGTTTSYGHATAMQTETGNTYRNISANISGLMASHVYHFRIVATNSAGTRYGADRVFVTP